MPPLDSLSRRLLRQAVLRVHPDVFAGADLEAASFNAESLVKLNAFVESLAQGKRPRATRLDFWIYEDNAESEEGAEGTGERNQAAATRRVSATLPRSGSLLPLFAALGLATAEELAAAAEGEEGRNELLPLEGGESDGGGLGAEEADLLEWLAAAARSAAAAGGRRAALRAALGAAAADAAQRHGLCRPVLLPDCDGPSSASRASLSRALKAVRALDEAMARFAEEGEGEESATEEGEEEEGGDEKKGVQRSGDAGGGSGAFATGGLKFPFRGLSVRLHTPPPSRRRRKTQRSEAEAVAEGDEGEDEGEGDEDEGEAAAWVSESDGALCVLSPSPRRRRRSRGSSSSSPSPSPASFLRALRSESADLPTARALSAARAYWQRRAAELAGPAAEALGVERVSWAECDEEDDGDGGRSGGPSPRSTAEGGGAGAPMPSSPARRFVSWAAAVLGEAGPLSSSSTEQGQQDEEAAGFSVVQTEQQSEEEGSLPPSSPSRRLSLSVVVHSEGAESFSSLAFFVAGDGGGGRGGGGEGFPSEASAAEAPPFQVSAGTLHVSAASPPGRLLSFLRSEDGAAAALAAEREAEERERAEREMEAAARAVGAAAVVRVSPSASLEEVAAAARRLAGAAPLLAAAGIDLTGVTLAIDDVFEAWHDESDSDSDSSSSDGEEEEGEGDGRSGMRGRYCGILSVPWDFEAPDLGAAVARLMQRSSLPPASSSSDGEEGEQAPREEEDAFPAGFEPSEAGRERFFDVSAPGATAAAARGARGRMMPLPRTLFLRGRGRKKTRSARRPSLPPPLRAAVAPRAVASSSASSSSTRSPLLHRMLIM